MKDALLTNLQKLCDASQRFDSYIPESVYSKSANDRLRVLNQLFAQTYYSLTYTQQFDYHDYVLTNAFFGPWGKPGALWITCHHDHIGGTGAIDNGTGLIVMIEVAKNIGWSSDLVFVSFSGEEKDLRGAKQCIKQNPNIASKVGAIINLECLAAKNWDTVITLTKKHAKSDPRLVKLIQDANSNLQGIDCPDYKADQIPFFDIGVPVVELMGHPSTSSTWPVHTKDDTIEQVDFDELQRIVDTVTQTVQSWRGNP